MGYAIVVALRCAVYNPRRALTSDELALAHALHFGNGQPRRQLKHSREFLRVLHVVHSDSTGGFPFFSFANGMVQQSLCSAVRVQWSKLEEEWGSRQCSNQRGRPVHRQDTGKGCNRWR